jgi:hypothetical protein
MLSIIDGYSGKPVVNSFKVDGVCGFHRLISCPVLADMSEWRIVTAEDMQANPRPCKEVQYLDETSNLGGHPIWKPVPRNPLPAAYSAVVLYRVPLDFDFEDEVECTNCKVCGVVIDIEWADRHHYTCSVCMSPQAPTTCPDCNKAESVCECGIQRAFRATIAENAAPDTLELLDPYNRRYETHIVKMMETINALIKRTEALT